MTLNYKPTTKAGHGDYGFPSWLKFLMSNLRPNWLDNGLGNDTAKALSLLDTFYEEDNEKMLTAVRISENKARRLHTIPW